jgi:hypothetical protein
LKEVEGLLRIPTAPLAMPTVAIYMPSRRMAYRG